MTWSQNRLQWGRGSERPAAHTQQKFTQVPPPPPGIQVLFAKHVQGNRLQVPHINVHVQINTVDIKTLIFLTIIVNVACEMKLIYIVFNLRSGDFSGFFGGAGIKNTIRRIFWCFFFWAVFPPPPQKRKQKTKQNSPDRRLYCLWQFTHKTLHRAQVKQF